MRSVPIFTICTALLAVIIAGCTGGTSIDMDEPGTIALDRWWIKDDSGDLTSDRQLHVRRSAVAQQYIQPGDEAAVEQGGLGASESITRRTAAGLMDWEIHRDELQSTLRTVSPPVRVQISAAEPVIFPESVFSGNVSLTDEEIAIRRKYSAAYFNGHLRVSLLQSRLEAADDVRRAILTTKLEQAEKELLAVDEACLAEIHQSRQKAEETSARVSAFDTSSDDLPGGGILDRRQVME